MANYVVYMGQGVSVADLRGNVLVTGPGNAEDAVQSCSVVMFIHPTTWRAGLYHFPSGSINTDAHSRDALTAMATAVAPTEAYIGFGIVGMRRTDPGENQRVQSLQGEQLRSFVLRLLPLTSRLRRLPAGGTVTLTTNAGRVLIGNVAPDPLVDLRTAAAGAHGAYTTYGHAE
jgi:hypothetical protein